MKLKQEDTCGLMIKTIDDLATDYLFYPAEEYCKNYVKKVWLLNDISRFSLQRRYCWVEINFKLKLNDFEA